jgi:xanthine dehydrogenase accessory factor
MNVIAHERPAQAERDTWPAARTWLEEHGRVMIATVVSTWGSAPVPVGGQLVVAPGERFEGSVSGGCVEVDVIAEAADVMAAGRPKLLAFGVAEETAWRAGLPCGGKIEVYLEPLVRGRDEDYLDRVLAARQARTPLAVATDLATGARHLYEAGSDMPTEVSACLSARESRLVDTAQGRKFVQALVPRVRVVIAGATHAGQVLAELARHVGYDVTVIDPRPMFATEDRLGRTKALAERPETSLPSLGLDGATAVVALTHAAHIDDEALSIALSAPCFYVGALGSRTTHARRIERLKAAGFSDAQISRIHAPVGLAIGAKGPAEIAVSILAEIIKVARGAK